jgi:hypothetical protein
MSSGKLTYMRVERGITTAITIDGPVSFMVTTTKNRLNMENESRMLSLYASDSEAQTRRVFEKIASTRGLIDEPPIDDERLGGWRDFQRHLAGVAPHCKSIIPYGNVLAQLVGTSDVRLRRDFGQLLTGIEAHALIHHETRFKDRSRGGAAEWRIHASIRDYAALHWLMTPVIAASLGAKKVSDVMAETIDCVRVLQPQALNAGVTAQDVAKHLDINKSSSLRRLQGALEAGLVVNLQTHPNRPGAYRVSEAVNALTVLPTPEALAEAWRKVGK